MNNKNMSIWQTKSWGKFLVSSGQADEIFHVDGIQVEKRQVALGEYGLFALGVSPKNITKKTYQNLEDLSKQQKALFIQIETIDYNQNSSLNIAWSEKYYKKFITPHTALIDLEKPEDEILASMKPKGRYNIKLARKKGVEIIQSDDIESFYTLIQETTSRDKFAGNSKQYYKKFLSQNENATLLVAQFEGQTIAAGIFIFEKEISIYYYGASTSNKKYRNLMAPYLLQWEAILRAKKTGSKFYDFLGVAGPNEHNSELIGVTNFKKKLTSDIREVSKSYLYINKKIKYQMIAVLRKLKK